MDNHLHQATIIDRKLVAVETYEMVFKFDEDFDFQAGQYVWIILPKLYQSDPRGARRAFSIISSPSQKRQISIVFRGSPSGFKQSLINAPLRGKVQISGPFGFRILPSNTQKRIIFAAGGVGIAPFMSMLRWVAENNKTHTVTLLYANTSVQRMAYVDELNKLEKQISTLRVINKIGELDELFLSQIPQPTECLWYIAGPQTFVERTSRFLLQQGVDPAVIAMEEFAWLGSADLGRIASFDLTSPMFFKIVTEQSHNHIIITDTNGIICFGNAAAERITGYKLSEMTGQTPRLWGGLMDKEFYQNLWQTIKFKHKPFIGEVINRRKNGILYTARIVISPVIDNQGNLLAFVSTEEDLTKEKEIEKLRVDFLALASHQLRTPLSGTKWLIETLQRKVLGPTTPKQEEYLNQIYQLNERMIKLAFDTLSVLQLESGTIAVKKEIISIPDIYKDLLIMMGAAAKNKGVILRNNLKGHRAAVVETDTAKLQSILECFISNAINYSNPGQEVVLDAKEETTATVFLVKDSGIGIPEEEQKKIFERFYRASNAKAIRPDGTGLGLYIAAMLAEKIGAEVLFDSTEGKGSTFYLRVPKKGRKKIIK